jgi:hypothetical protein
MEPIKISGEDRRKYREKLRRSLGVFERMLRECFRSAFRLSGRNQLNLVDDRGGLRCATPPFSPRCQPRLGNGLGQFSIEIGVPPRRLIGLALGDLKTRADLNAADTKARASGAAWS